MPGQDPLGTPFRTTALDKRLPGGRVVVFAFHCTYIQNAKSLAHVVEGIRSIDWITQILILEYDPRGLLLSDIMAIRAGVCVAPLDRLVLYRVPEAGPPFPHFL